MRVINPGEVWLIDFGMAAKVRPALLLTDTPADDELDLVTVVLHSAAISGNSRWRSLFSERERFICSKCKRFRPSSWSGGWGF